MLFLTIGAIVFSKYFDETREEISVGKFFWGLRTYVKTKKSHKVFFIFIHMKWRMEILNDDKKTMDEEYITGIL